MAIPNNEGKACDSVIRLLEERTGMDRADISRPEQTGNGPPVELRLNLGTQNYAIEHTQIEAFAGQIRMEEEFARFINPVTDELSEKLPGPAVYYLYFPINARLGVNTRQLDEIRRDFIAWIREHAQHLHEMNPDRPTKEQHPRGYNEQYRARPPGIPYEVTLQREAHWSLSSRHDGVLLVARMAPEDVQELRIARLGRALKRKCPKLQRCRADGARTVLVLEDGDIALSNHVLIGEGLARAMEDQADLPDEIYLVQTALDRWVVRCMKYDETFMPDEQWAEFKSAELTDMTGVSQE